MTDAARPVTPALTMETALAKIAADADNDRNGDPENWHVRADDVLVDLPPCTRPRHRDGPLRVDPEVVRMTDPEPLTCPCCKGAWGPDDRANCQTCGHDPDTYHATWTAVYNLAAIDIETRMEGACTLLLRTLAEHGHGITRNDNPHVCRYDVIHDHHDPVRPTVWIVETDNSNGYEAPQFVAAFTTQELAETHAAHINANTNEFAAAAPIDVLDTIPTRITEYIATAVHYPHNNKTITDVAQATRWDYEAAPDPSPDMHQFARKAEPLRPGEYRAGLWLGDQPEYYRVWRLASAAHEAETAAAEALTQWIADCKEGHA